MVEFKVDITNCDKEPIHVLGKIQGHGFLIAVDCLILLNLKKVNQVLQLFIIKTSKINLNHYLKNKRK